MEEGIKPAEFKGRLWWECSYGDNLESRNIKKSAHGWFGPSVIPIDGLGGRDNVERG